MEANHGHENGRVVVAEAHAWSHSLDELDTNIGVIATMTLSNVMKEGPE
jgi:hypothetical protein